MRKNKRSFWPMMLLMIVAIASGTAGAGTSGDAKASSMTIEPGLTKVSIPASVGVPAPLPAPLPITGLPKPTLIKPRVDYVSCTAQKPSTTGTASAASCGGGGSSGVTYWWQGSFWVGSRAGTWYEFVQEFEWHVEGATITSISVNLCYSRSGSWHYHGCGGPNGEHDGSPLIVQRSSSTVRVLAEWDYHFHRTNDYQSPNTDIRFGADGSIVGTVWYQ